MLALVLAAALAAPIRDAFLGMPAPMQLEVRGQIRTMRDLQGQDWTPEVEATAPVGPDTLVMWRWPMPFSAGLGVQVYGPDGQFKLRLEDSNIPSARAVVCADRYVVGGGNTLRVWDAARGYRLVNRRSIPGLSQSARLSCQGLRLSVQDSRDGGKSWPNRTFAVPGLDASQARPRR